MIAFSKPMWKLPVQNSGHEALCLKKLKNKTKDPKNEPARSGIITATH